MWNPTTTHTHKRPNKSCHLTIKSPRFEETHICFKRQSSLHKTGSIWRAPKWRISSPKTKSGLNRKTPNAGRPKINDIILDQGLKVWVSRMTFFYKMTWVTSTAAITKLATSDRGFPREAPGRFPQGKSRQHHRENFVVPLGYGTFNFISQPRIYTPYVVGTYLGIYDFDGFGYTKPLIIVKVNASG